MVQEVIINGQVGRLEGKLHKSEDARAPIALVLHPHPLHGGTMNNKVSYHMFHAFVKAGFSVLRFNFRGVGKSDGEYSAGVGELVDAATAMDWLQSQCPDHSTSWISGFSFGAWITLQLLMRRPELAGFVAVSPPASSYDFTFLSPCPTQGLIVQGAQDKIAKEEAVYALYQKMAKQRNSKIDYQLLDGDHFFSGNLEVFASTIEEYMVNKLSEVDDVVTRSRRDRRKSEDAA